MKKENAIRNDVRSTHHGKRYKKNHDVGREDTKKNISSVLYRKSEHTRNNIKAEKMYQGLFIDLLDRLSIDLKFKYVLKSSTRGYGSLDSKNGNWSGIIRKLVHRVMDY